MKKACATLVLLGLLLAVALPALVNADDSAPSSTTVVTPPDDQDRGAGYLPYSDPTPLGSGGFFGAILRATFSLAIVIGLLYATLWTIRKFMGGSTGPFAEGPIRVVGRIYLSPKIVVYFVKLVDKLLVIGANSGSITLLTTIEAEDEVSKIENAVKSAITPGSGLAFSRFFDKSLTGFQKELQKDDSVFDDRLRMLNEQINRLKGLARKRQRDEE